MVLKKRQLVSLRKQKVGIYLFFFFFYAQCIPFSSYLKKEKEPNLSPTSFTDKESYLVLRLVRGKDKTMGLIEEIPVTLTFETDKNTSKQSFRIYPLPLAESKDPFFLPFFSKAKYQESELLIGCLYFFPIPSYFRGNLKLEIHHVKWTTKHEFVFQKVVPYDWQGNLTKYWEYDLDHSEITDKTIPSLSSYRHLECEDDIRHRKEIPKKGIISPPEED